MTFSNAGTRNSTDFIAYWYAHPAHAPHHRSLPLPTFPRPNTLCLQPHTMTVRSPADADPRVTAPIRFAYCDEDVDYLTTGDGTVNFNMTNIRSDGVFYFVTGDVDAPVVRNKADTLKVTFENYAVPLKPRVLASGDIDKMWVMWSSNGSHTQPRLQYGTKSGHYSTTVTPTEDVIQREELCGAPAAGAGWHELGTIYKAEMLGMTHLAKKETRKVYYRFGDEATGQWSEEYTFFVPPLAGQKSKGRGTRLIMYDDLGRGSTDDSYTWHEYGRPSIHTTMAAGDEVRRGTVDAIYHGGDISYATGYLSTWDYFLNQLSPVASAVPYLTNMGNHESDWPWSASYYFGEDSGGECGVCSTRLLPLPTPNGEPAGANDTGGTNKPWWGYDVGLFHLVGMSTEHNYTTGSEQWNFLKEDLASVDRCKTPWVIFGGHRAMYLNSDYDSGFMASDGSVSKLMIEHLEPLFLEYNVDLGFYGHNHVVQRQSAIINSTVVQAATDETDDEGNVIATHRNPGAPVHMVIGTGGGTFTKTAYYGSERPEWNELTFYRYGYARIEAVSAEELQWQWVEGNTSIIYDRMAIYKDPNPLCQAGKSDDDNSSNDDDGALSPGNTAAIVVSVLVGSGVIIFVALRWSGTQAASKSDRDPILAEEYTGVS